VADATDVGNTSMNAATFRVCLFQLFAGLWGSKLKAGEHFSDFGVSEANKIYYRSR